MVMVVGAASVTQSRICKSASASGFRIALRRERACLYDVLCILHVGNSCISSGYQRWFGPSMTDGVPAKAFVELSREFTIHCGCDRLNEATVRAFNQDANNSVHLGM